MFHTTSYSSFEDLSQKFLNGIDLVHKTISLAFIERMGLRYLNAFTSDTNDKLSDYIANSLLGFTAVENSTLIQKYVENISQINEGTLVARAIFSSSGIVIPPDLYPLILRIQDRFERIKDETAIIDIDYYKISRFNLDNALIEEKLSEFHDIINSVFRNSITPHAIKILE